MTICNPRRARMQNAHAIYCGHRTEASVEASVTKGRPPRPWTIPALLLVAASCGMEPKVITEYYIEEPKTGDTARPSDVNSTTDGPSGTSDGRSSGHSKLGSFTMTLQLPEVIAGGNLPDSENPVVNIGIDGSGTAEDDFAYSLYYATGNEDSDSVLIVGSLDAATTSVEWNTKGIASGKYTVYAVEDGFNNTVSNAISSRTTVIEASGPKGNSSPNLRLVSPNGENVFLAGSDNLISFNGSDPDGDGLVYSVDYSADGGTTWTNLTDNLTEQSYVWSAAGLDQGITYKVRVTAEDPEGATAVASSAKAFGLALTPMTFAEGFGTMLNDNCGGCHRAGGRNAAQFRSDNYDLANIGVADKMMNIKNRIEADEMPTAMPLSQAGKEILTMWLWSGGE